MIFPDKKSALVRLSDSLKSGLTTASATAQEIVDIYVPHEAAFQEARTVAREVLAGRLDGDRARAKVSEAMSGVSQNTLEKGAGLQGQLHGQVLSTVLLSCFCLESYINSLAYFVFEETDLLGLIRGGHKASSELLIAAIEKMSTRDKWVTLGRLKGASGFDPSCTPFQDFKVLFNFRDDHVHDKVVDMSDGRVKKRYNGKLPDPVFGMLTLDHALYAATTYWSMVSTIHQLLEIPAAKFQRHYNLSPWFEDAHQRYLEKVATSYRVKIDQVHGSA